MSDWQRTIKLGDVWDSEDIQLIARTAADRLEALEPFTSNPSIDTTKKTLVARLRKLADNPKTTPRQFDRVWEAVYDWADTPLDQNFGGKRVCFISLWEKP